MIVMRHIKLLLTLGSLAASTVAVPSTQQPLGEKDVDDDTPLPLVIWHGLGDSFANSALRTVGDLADAIHPGTFTYIIQLADDANGDQQATFLGNVTTQLASVCAALAAHPILSTAPAIDALGFSQGGQFLRGYVERCNSPPVRSLVTFGSQHNGISAFRSCAAADWLCRGAMALLRGNAWGALAQSRVVPAQYFRDPADGFGHYLEHSNFLADINNEREGGRVRSYADNLAALDNFVMYRFEDDTTVVPPETAWFQEVNGTVVTPLRERRLYSEDWLGLRALDRKGGLKFRTTPGDHMQLSGQVLNETFREFYGPLKRKSSTKLLNPGEL